jgi:LAO/AO transport system kinase
MTTGKDFIKQLQEGDYRALAKGISLVENDPAKGRALLKDLSFDNSPPVIGLTGPPGAGKSSLLNNLLQLLVEQDKKAGVITIDPTSPFNYGALLGDRIRLQKLYTHPNIYIRSIATRGALGGLSATTVEVVDLMRAAPFDYLFVETVGVGQSEVEIAGLADTTIVILVPESGDAVQTLKSGVMEIADIFVVNKSDRPGTQKFVKHLKALVRNQSKDQNATPVIQTIATQQQGSEELLHQIKKHHQSGDYNAKKNHLLTQKALTIIQRHRMRHINEQNLLSAIEKASQQNGFNLYAFVEKNYLND